MSYFPFGFTGLIERHDLGRYRYTVMWLPDDVSAQLPLAENPRLRISGELNEHPFSGAWQPSRGRWYLMLGKPLLKQTNLSLGCLAELRFRVDAPNEVDVPALLTSAIAENAAATLRWSSLTPGKQRAVGHHILAAKTGATMTRRVGQAILWLESGETDLRRLPKLLPR